MSHDDFNQSNGRIDSGSEDARSQDSHVADERRSDDAARAEQALSSIDASPGYDEKVRTRAHQIWERKGKPHGEDQSHWMEAEAEIQAEEVKRS